MKLSEELRPKREKREKKSPPSGKPKGYLNAKEQEELMVLAAFAGKLEELIETWSAVGVDKCRLKEARTTLSFLYRTMDSFVASVQDDSIIKRVAKKLKYTSIEIKTGG